MHKHRTPSDAPPSRPPIRDWLPLFIVFGFIGLLTAISLSMSSYTFRDSMNFLMGYFFLIFSLFKMIDLKGFASGYHEYDIVSKKWYGWGYVVPFIELALGSAYLFRIDAVLLHLSTLLFSVLVCFSVSQKLAKKEKHTCACLGTVLKVPLTTISLVEYLIMAVMAVYMVVSPAPTMLLHTHDTNTFNTYNSTTGEQYDRMYLHEMLDHHQGAVDMVSLIKNQAKHEELLHFAQEIDIAQRAEISSMQSWQKEWGYTPTAHDHQMTHMHIDMQYMYNELLPLKGDAFDKRFLELMISHHQMAVDMSLSGPKNALHSELQELTKSIVLTQSREIAQMHAWQHEWGYEK